MLSKHIGVIYAKESKEIRAVINPAYDFELDDPSLLRGEEERRMLKLNREGFPELATSYYITKTIETAKELLRE